jgi:hypothetical protein
MAASYMQQRYFGFGDSRFWSPDSVGATAESFNRYAYANNNPYTFVDPDGKQARTAASHAAQAMAAPPAEFESDSVQTQRLANKIDSAIVHSVYGMLQSAGIIPSKQFSEEGGEAGQAPEQGTRKLGELEPIHAPDHPQNDPGIGSLSDGELGEAINNPSNGDRVTVRGNRVLDGNTRINEAKARGWPTNTTIPVDELPELPSNINDDPLGPYRDQH